MGHLNYFSHVGRFLFVFVFEFRLWLTLISFLVSMSICNGIANFELRKLFSCWSLLMRMRTENSLFMHIARLWRNSLIRITMCTASSAWTRSAWISEAENNANKKFFEGKFIKLATKQKLAYYACTLLPNGIALWKNKEPKQQSFLGVSMSDRIVILAAFARQKIKILVLRK